MREVRLTNCGLVALVDDEDYERVSKYNWQAEREKSTWYAVRSNHRKDRPARMHRYILNAPMGTEVDHKDRNGLNNVRSNLRLATVRQNQGNSGLRITNSSGYKGVHWSKNKNRWVAQIRSGGSKKKSLGCYSTAEEAAKAYDRAAIKEFGEFAWLNFPSDALAAIRAVCADEGVTLDDNDNT